MMNALQGQDAEVRFTVTVTRKDTGKVESFEMVGKVVKDVPQDQQKEQK